MHNTFIVVSLATLAAVTSVVPAQYVGNTITVGQRFSNVNDTFGFQDTDVVQPGGTLFGPFNQVGDNELEIMVFDAQIDLNFIIDGGFSGAAFNGYAVNDTNGAIADIIGVDLLSTDVIGFTQDRITFTADEVRLNLQDLTYLTDDTISVGVRFIPAPAGTGLLALAGFAAVRRRR